MISKTFVYLGIIKNKETMKAKMKTYICYNAGCDIYVIEIFNPSIDWHKNEFQGTYAECLQEKESQEQDAYRFNNCMPHLSHC